VPKQTVKKTNTLNTPKIEEPKVIVKEEPKKEVSEPIAVRSEIKSLSLNNSKAGRASYFFSGPSGGKFYVATNLASKGEIVKVINPDNGKFVMAEVLSSLPSSDAAKGIILKLSDNAKLPLGQKNSSFAVKVNY
jgi:3-polyprenyl-4-hydroxybenzoate decarboxylase